ncbi:hypothetical protein ACIQD1_32900 [Streptomyces sp. NPDC093088]|uniref:hypothetical protein n=1 Tax=Streptomyces sp. NPDC093088 TaxID=3366023 RepID=UPI00381EA344
MAICADIATTRSPTANSGDPPATTTPARSQPGVAGRTGPTSRARVFQSTGLRLLVPMCPDLVAQLRQERERITRAIDELRSSRGILDRVIDAQPQRTALRST